VREYLDDQGVQPFFDISDRYGALYAKMLALLEHLDSKELDRGRSDARRRYAACRRTRIAMGGY
jgi:hypothetical protein